ncbi:type II secretion system protein [Amnibacterium setariae]|uniref:type II secretion system protein n=1 Tax=Amnibacterium setariae TaxID=2306585 RepID=UPI0018F503F3|nr:prepilin-type N-terminal cleavage/methylation domain-containing protein [Amnibacterium setariae]
MSITTALSARRDALRDREAGFTLIELLVVVLIIGILAAIAIPVYLGVQNNAKDSAVKSDLVNEKTALAAYGTDANGAVPSAVTAAGSATTPTGTVNLTTYGWSKSTNSKDLKFTPGTGTNAGLWCVLGTSTTGKFFAITSNTQVTPVNTAACPTGAW